MVDHPRLMAVDGPNNGVEYPIASENFSMGRASENALTIIWDGSVSRQHARIYRQSGLFWLQDLGSSNGTFLSLHGSQERALKPQESVLLLDGAELRLGRHTRFHVAGLVRSEDEALQMLMGRLQQAMGEMYAGLAHLDPAGRDRQCAWLRGFEERLKSAADENELYQIASEGTQTLFGTFVGELPAAPELPPLPDDLPDPDSPHRLNSIRNYFIDDIRNCFPEDEQPDD